MNNFIDTKKIEKKGISYDEFKEYLDKTLYNVSLLNHFKALVVPMDNGEFRGISTDTSGADLSEPRCVVGKKIGNYNVIYLLDSSMPGADYVHETGYERYIMDGETCIQKTNREKNDTTVMNSECEVSEARMDTSTLLSIIQTSKRFNLTQVRVDAENDMESLATPLPDESGDLNIDDVIAKDQESKDHHLV